MPVLTLLLVLEYFFFLFVALRPKHLLVYINPYGGKKKGKQIYEKKVAPLFSLASISTDVIGKKRNEMKKINIYALL